MKNPIDVVFTWVDGNDPHLNALRRKYAGESPSGLDEETAGETRYSNLGELGYAVACVNRFMPWVRKIFIVTDGQDPMPQLFAMLQHFSAPIPIQVVDHRVIFHEDSDLLPVFNSISIESMIWRIPDLSERYVYFNDDMMPVRYMKPEEWFSDGKLILHGHHMPRWWAEILDRLRRKDGKPTIGFKTALIAAARALGKRHLLFYYHSPLPQFKSLLEQYFLTRRDELRRNAAPRFREREQYTAQSLCTLLAEESGRIIIDKRKNSIFLKPVSSRPDYLTERLKRIDERTEIKLLCINSLDKASAEQQKEFKTWICQRLGIRI